MAAGRPHTRALHQEESGGARRPRAPETASPSRSQILLLCVRACRRGSSSAIVSKKSSERSPLSDQQSPARTLLYTSVARQKQAGAEKPVRDPEDGRRLTLKRDDLIISGNVVFLFLFFPSAGVSTWGRKGDNGSLICFIYSFR